MTGELTEERTKGTFVGEINRSKREIESEALNSGLAEQSLRWGEGLSLNSNVLWLRRLRFASTFNLSTADPSIAALLLPAALLTVPLDSSNSRSNSRSIDRTSTEYKPPVPLFLRTSLLSPYKPPPTAVATTLRRRRSLLACIHRHVSTLPTAAPSNSSSIARPWSHPAVAPFLFASIDTPSAGDTPYSYSLLQSTLLPAPITAAPQSLAHHSPFPRLKHAYPHHSHQAHCGPPLCFFPQEKTPVHALSIFFFCLLCIWLSLPQVRPSEEAPPSPSSLRPRKDASLSACSSSSASQSSVTSMSVSSSDSSPPALKQLVLTPPALQQPAPSAARPAPATALKQSLLPQSPSLTPSPSLDCQALCQQALAAANQAHSAPFLWRFYGDGRFPTPSFIHRLRKSPAQTRVWNASPSPTHFFSKKDGRDKKSIHDVCRLSVAPVYALVNPADSDWRTATVESLVSLALACFQGSAAWTKSPPGQAL
eukprot:jgi/Psemu1/50619/gm1.50619_g